MTPFIFPTAVAILLFGSWVVLASFEPCTSQNSQPKFDCWTSIQFAGIFACIGSVLTGLIALLARVVLHPLLPFKSRKPEMVSALLASTVLIIVFYSVLLWEFDFGHIGIRAFVWLGVSLIVCGSSLMIVKYQTVDRRA